MKKYSKIVFILAVSSDIGLFIAREYLRKGCRVVGTYRTKSAGVSALQAHPACDLLRCDITKPGSLSRCLDQYKALKAPWDIFISCVGDPRPVQAFFEADFNQWAESVEVNALAQLRALHGLYPLRRAAAKTHAVFFAGGGVNKPVKNFSAYTVSKLMLIKMCEYLDAENKDLNVFIIGPGWTKTKIHQVVLNDPHVPADKSRATVRFLKVETGTPYQDIYDCIERFMKAGKTVASGRNFSVVHDPWKGDGGKELMMQLKRDPHLYKLRRHGSLQKER
ncbi:MAG: SDR family oxidoreductase [Candidatus Omnitrophota bacterium]